jgi:hypothetical protein
MKDASSMYRRDQCRDLPAKERAMSNVEGPGRKPRARGLQFSLVTLLVVMSWVATLCVALRRPTELWAAAMLGITLLALLVSGLAIIYRRGATQAFAVGFFVFGGAYLLCVLWLGGFTSSGMSHVSSALYARWHGPGESEIRYQVPVGAYYPAATPVTTYAPVIVQQPAYQPSTTAWPPTGAMPQPANQVYVAVQSAPYQPGPFNDIFHSGCALIVAVVGGIVAQVLHRTRRDPDVEGGRTPA